MLRKTISLFVLAVLLQSTVGCTGKYWKDPHEILALNRSRQQGKEIVSATSGADTINFKGSAAYDAHCSVVVGLDSLGCHVGATLGTIDSVTVRQTDAVGMHHDRRLSGNQVLKDLRLRRTSPEPIYAATLASESTRTEMNFALGSGRLWLFDSTLTGLTQSGDSISYSWDQVSMVKVKRFSKTKTILLTSPLIAMVTLGVVTAIFDWHPMEW